MTYFRNSFAFAFEMEFSAGAFYLYEKSGGVGGMGWSNDKVLRLCMIYRPEEK